MTRIFLATVETLQREHPLMKNHPKESVLVALALMRSVTHAATIAHGDFPIVIYGFPEEMAVRILAHEENHRAVLAIGEGMEASRSLDDPWTRWAVEGVRVPRGYRHVHEFVNGLRGASPKTEAR